MRPIDTSRWQQGYSAYRHFVEVNGHGAVPKGHVAEDDFALGKWVANQRSLAAASRLLPARRDVLDADEAWTWTARDDAWLAGYACLRDFVGIHHRMPRQTESHEGLRLGIWVRTQRRAYAEGRLTIERATLLAGVPGWVWNTNWGS